MGTAEISLKNGEISIVDLDDYEHLSGMKWHLWGKYPATRFRGKHLYMHQCILGKAPKGYCIDHINGDRFDNRKSNLRVVTHSVNNSNRHVVVGASPYKGVYKHRGGGWVAQIIKDGTRHYLGYFKTELEAARAYNKKASELFGEFAFRNEA